MELYLNNNLRLALLFCGGFNQCIYLLLVHCNICSTETSCINTLVVYRQSAQLISYIYFVAILLSTVCVCVCVLHDIFTAFHTNNFKC